MRCWIGLVVAAAFVAWPFRVHAQGDQEGAVCLLYTSDAADDNRLV